MVKEGIWLLNISSSFHMVKLYAAFFLWREGLSILPS